MILLSPKDAYPLKAIARYICTNMRPSKEAEDVIYELLMGQAEIYYNIGFYANIEDGNRVSPRRKIILVCRKTGEIVEQLSQFLGGKLQLKLYFCARCDDVHSTQQVKESIDGQDP